MPVHRLEDYLPNDNTSVVSKCSEITFPASHIFPTIKTSCYCYYYILYYENDKISLHIGTCAKNQILSLCAGNPA